MKTLYLYWFNNAKIVEKNQIVTKNYILWGAPYIPYPLLKNFK